MKNRKPENSDVLDSITQFHLASYVAMEEQAHTLLSQWRDTRDRLARSVQCGAKVEPGPLRPFLAMIEQRSVTCQEVERLLGRKLLDEMRSHIKPHTVKLFSVFDNDEPDKAA